MTDKTTSSISRRGLLGAFAATAVIAAPTYSNAAGFLRGGGDIRRLKMYSGRTGESIDTIYWIEGNYIPEAVDEVNRFFRDWRNRHRGRDAKSFGQQPTLHPNFGLPLTADERDVAVQFVRCCAQFSAPSGSSRRFAHAGPFGEPNGTRSRKL
jgi:hypothetical protein